MHEVFLVERFDSFESPSSDWGTGASVTTAQDTAARVDCASDVVERALDEDSPVQPAFDLLCLLACRTVARMTVDAGGRSSSIVNRHCETVFLPPSQCACGAFPPSPGL